MINKENPISNRWVIISSILGLLGVAIGALGAHLLKQFLTPETTEIFKTGVLYHLVHAVVMLAVSLSGRSELCRANKFFFSGIILFSFSLYIYSLTSMKFLAMITPFGGVTFLLGWLVFIWQGRERELKIKN